MSETASHTRWWGPILVVFVACSAPAGVRRQPTPRPLQSTPMGAKKSVEVSPPPEPWRKTPAPADCEVPDLWKPVSNRWADDWPEPLDVHYVWAVIQERTPAVRMIEPVERLRKGLLGLELLLSRMRKASPDRPRGLVRLGRSYLDLSKETVLEAQRLADGGRHCELLRESARALKRAERAFSEVVEQHWDGEARAAALLLKASVIGPTEPARAIALCEELSKFQAGVQRVPACRVLTAELLSVETSQRDRAALELERISRRDRPIELYFIARHRIAEIAWARGDGRRAAEQLQRALASTHSALLRERIERNLAHIRKNSGKLVTTPPAAKRH